MEITVSYCPNQLEAAVKFIAENNPAFLGKHVYIRKSLTDGIKEIAQRFPELHSSATMGYILLANHFEEGIDQDKNHVHIEIFVDPGLFLDFEPDVEMDFYFPDKE